MTGRPSTTWFRIVQRAALVAVMLAVVVVLMMWLMGVFKPKIEAAVATQPAGRPVGNARLEPVRLVAMPVFESSVGTIRPVHEASVASKLLAKVVAVNVIAGKPVTKGEVLIQLDDQDLRARSEQASAAVRAAEAARDQAKTEYERIEKLQSEQAAAALEVNRAINALKSAEADVQRAQQALNEARTILSYSTITSPLTGIVVDKKVDVGDMVAPGTVLVTLYDPLRMQLVASVRESITHRLAIGQSIQVEVSALGHPCEAEVSEIVPEAQSTTRSFSVKVTGPCPKGVYPGMFGRLLIPTGEERILVVPRQAVRKVGQLDLVEVAEGDALRLRVVQPGRVLGDDVQVLSGLAAGERVAVDAGIPATGPSEGA